MWHTPMQLNKAAHKKKKKIHMAQAVRNMRNNLIDLLIIFYIPSTIDCFFSLLSIIFSCFYATAASCITFFQKGFLAFYFNLI